MYKIIGADGRQYGPVTAETVRDWIANNRANALTLIQAEGGTEWKPLSTFAEFADALAASPVSPPAPPGPEPAPFAALPPPPAPDANAFAEEILQRGREIDIGGCFSRAWVTLTNDFWPIVGISALIWLLLSAAGSIVILTGPLLGGLCWYYLKQLRGEKPAIHDAFAGFSLAFIQLLLAFLVSHLLIALGVLLCVVPGIYLGVAWCLALPLVIDKKLSFWDAMEVSRRVVHRQWWSFLALFLLSFLLNLVGGLLCCVGGFVTGPLTGLALMYAYEDIFGTPRSPGA